MLMHCYVHYVYFQQWQQRKAANGTNEWAWLQEDTQTAILGAHCFNFPPSTQAIWLASIRAWVTVEGSSGWVLLLLWICWVIIKTEPNGIAEREVSRSARRGWGQTDRHQMNKLWWAPFAVMRSNARLQWLTVQFPANVSHFKMS